MIFFYFPLYLQILIEFQFRSFYFLKLLKLYLCEVDILKFDLLQKYMFQCQAFLLINLLYIFLKSYNFLSFSSSISSKSPSIKLFFLVFVVLNFFTNLPKINFLVIGNINKNPKMSVANPGIIRSNAAKAIAAPDIIS